MKNKNLKRILWICTPLLILFLFFYLMTYVSPKMICGRYRIDNNALVRYLELYEDGTYVAIFNPDIMKKYSIPPEENEFVGLWEFVGSNNKLRLFEFPMVNAFHMYRNHLGLTVGRLPYGTIKLMMTEDDYYKKIGPVDEDN